MLIDPDRLCACINHGFEVSYVNRATMDVGVSRKVDAYFEHVWIEALDRGRAYAARAGVAAFHQPALQWRGLYKMWPLPVDKDQLSGTTIISTQTDAVKWEQLVATRALEQLLTKSEEAKSDLLPKFRALRLRVAGYLEVLPKEVSPFAVLREWSSSISAEEKAAVRRLAVADADCGDPVYSELAALLLLQRGGDLEPELFPLFLKGKHSELQVAWRMSLITDSLMLKFGCRRLEC